MPFVIRRFTAQKTLGSKLRALREERRMEIFDLAFKLKISEKYLDALEKSAYDKLPDIFYVKSFIKRYAAFFGQSVFPFIRLFEEELISAEKSTDPKTNLTPNIKRADFVVVPRVIKIALAGILIVLVFSYFGFQIRALTTPPAIVIFSPDDGALTYEPRVQVRGKTEKEVRLTINGGVVLASREGFFEDTIDLERGANIITITAAKRHGKPQTVYRRIVFEDRNSLSLKRAR